MDDASTVLWVDDRVAFFENYLCSHGAKDRARETKSPYGMGLALQNNKKSAPGMNRTCDLRIRSPLLYPTELRGHYP